MARDEALLRVRALPTLRFYKWDQPTVSLGRFQEPKDLSWTALSKNNPPIVHRKTGGKAILHADELTYALCAPEANVLSGGPARAMTAIHEILAAELSRQLGESVSLRRSTSALSDVEGSAWCFEDSSPLDLMLNNRKLLGSAARRSQGWVLFHGSLVLQAPEETPNIGAFCGNPNLSALARALGNGLKIDFQPGEWLEEEWTTLSSLESH